MITVFDKMRINGGIKCQLLRFHIIQIAYTFSETTDLINQLKEKIKDTECLFTICCIGGHFKTIIVNFVDETIQVFDPFQQQELITENCPVFIDPMNDKPTTGNEPPAKDQLVRLINLMDAVMV